EARQRRLDLSVRHPTGQKQQRTSMADIRNYQARAAAAGTRTDVGIDAGLRAYMVKVYNLMALGLCITGVAAVATMMLATTNDPASAVATLGNGKMLTSFGAVLY